MYQTHYPKTMKKLLKSFSYAWQGIVFAFKTQQNFRVEIILAFAVTIAAIMFQVSTLEWIIICINIFLVLSLELVNTALENTCNLYSTNINPTIKIIKDTAAASVLLVAIGSFVCASIIFLPKLINLYYEK